MYILGYFMSCLVLLYRDYFKGFELFWATISWAEHEYTKKSRVHTKQLYWKVDTLSSVAQKTLVFLRIQCILELVLSDRISLG